MNRKHTRFFAPWALLLAPMLLGNDDCDAPPPQNPPDDPGDGSGGEACGDVTCAEGLVCCNALCGICTPPGMACVQGCADDGDDGGTDPGPDPDPDPDVCGGLAGLTCGEGEFCNYETAAGGDGCDIADGQGVCRERPQACTREYVPVCGCDGETYGNRCDAHANGVSVASEGECGSDDDTCGGFAGVACERGEFCNYETAAGGDGCDIADGQGVCQERPQACTFEYAPVCGCDGKTYSNTCAAHSAGASVASKGECDGAGDTCGGIAGLTCGRGEFCNYEPPVGQGCDGSIADAAGKCEEIPWGCPEVWDPVCGCDGKTYGNRCEAHAAGASVLHEGMCTVDECKAAGGVPRYSNGASIPACAEDERDLGPFSGPNGQLPIEPTRCCAPAP